MINKFGKVMVYVNDPVKVADFWTNKIGFIKKSEQTIAPNVVSIELAPTLDSDASIVLIDKEFVLKMGAGVNLGTPSLLFSSFDVKKMRSRLEQEGVTVGDIIDMNGTLTFNFADTEGNYFAVSEVQK